MFKCFNFNLVCIVQYSREKEKKNSTIEEGCDIGINSGLLYAFASCKAFNRF